MAKIRRRAKPVNAKKVGQKIVEVRINGGSYRATADFLGGPLNHQIPPGSYGFLNGRAPGAPDLQVAEVELGEETVRIEVTPNDYRVIGN